MFRTMTAPNWANRTMWTGDNLDIMRGMNSESVDLIYLDPPFNSNRNYAAPIGSEAAGAAFKDTWTLDDVDLAWHGQIAEQQPALYAIIDAARLAHGKGMQSYLIMMAVRLLEMRRLLKDTGSIYLHCDPTASHYLKTLMDAVFGVENYRNEIVWCYTGPGSPKMRQFNRKHDTIHWYSKSDTWIFNADTIRLQHHEKTLKNHKEGLSGSGHADTPLRPGKVPESWWAERKGNGLAITARQQKQYVGYPTQKPLALLDRIIRASSNEDDVVLDPFCGCATACVAADRLNRQWAGIDLSPSPPNSSASACRPKAHCYTISSTAPTSRSAPTRATSRRPKPTNTPSSANRKATATAARSSFPSKISPSTTSFPNPAVGPTTSTTCSCCAGRAIARRARGRRRS